jgi:hypothetical protein
MTARPIETPVVLFLYKRPEKTALVLDAIAQARPKRLYVIADGPKCEEEGVKCQQTRATIQNLSWDCEVRTCFSDRNLGLGPRVSSGLDWVFSQELKAIILEDDCLPAPSFFSFCEVLLKYFEDDDRVVHIGGNNFQNGRRMTEYSYYFSKYTLVWGWATWRRAWQHFDYEIKDWPDFKKRGQLRQHCRDPFERRYWEKVFEAAYRGESNAWAAQWLFSCWKKRALAVVPSANLVSNIGFDADATHTIGNHPSAALPTADIWQIMHAPHRKINQEADEYMFDHHFGGRWMRENHTLRARGRRLASRLKRGIGSVLAGSGFGRLGSRTRR